jgi:hypothetical protein
MSVSERKIATVKWSKREYALIYCDNNQPGLIFGIVLKISCKPAPAKRAFITSKTEKCTLKGMVLFIGTYQACSEMFTLAMSNYMTDGRRHWIDTINFLKEHSENEFWLI